MNEEFKTCEFCNKKINVSQIHILADKIFCSECYENETFECDCCHKRFFPKERCTDGDTQICRRCCHDSYNRCTNCNCLVHSRNTLWDDDYPYCEDCFPDDEYDEDTQFRYISYHDYKPTPIFHKCTDEENVRYYGVELGIDDGGQDDDNAEKILYTATVSIMKEVLKDSFLAKEPCVRVNVDDGDIIRIDSNGKIEKSNFDFCKYWNYRGYSAYHWDYEEEITEQLYQVAEMNGISRDDINMLFEIGYGEEEIAMMIYDPEILEVCLEEARMYFEVDECI